jgi:GntR family transcriptional regulator/MocR family aminotransferase
MARRRKELRMLTYDLTRRGSTPLYEYLYLCVRRDIEQGKIAAGERLPSKRALANHLGVSLITVEAALSQLVAEGYVRSEARRGYFACALPRPAGTPFVGMPLGSASFGRAPGQATPGGTPQNLPAQLLEDEKQNAWQMRASGMAPKASIGASDMETGESLYGSPYSYGSQREKTNDQRYLADFRAGSPGVGMMPRRELAQAYRTVLMDASENQLVEAAFGQGSLRLRTAICSYLAGYRGMQASPEQVVIGSGSQYLYQLIAQLVGLDRTVALETPGYPRLASIYQAMGMRVAACILDEQGIDIGQLRASGAGMAHVMPSHQFPTGRIMGIARRYELLAWASQDQGRVIVEDDYDCEFRLEGRPVPSLSSIDTLGQVFYINTFTKTLGSGFRIGYAVLPPAWAERFRSQLGFYSCTVSAIDQLAIAECFERGTYDRLVRRMRSRYHVLQDDLIAALKDSELGPRLRFEALDSGLNFLMGVENASEDAFEKAARQEGVALAPLSDFQLASVGADAEALNGSGAQERTARDDSAARREEEKGAAQEQANDEEIPTAWFVMNYGGLDHKLIPATVEALVRASRQA